MGSPFDIVKDSSVWQNRHSFKAARQLDSTLYVGTVRSVFNDEATGELRYMVEVYHRGDVIPTPCRMVRRFGGVFNYEDTVLRGYSYNAPAGVAAKAGDAVLVGLVGGQGRDGVIIGGLTHPVRKNLSKDNGPEHRSEFNGVETYINKDGEYTLTFKAQPTNLADLDKHPAGPVKLPKYDEEVGSGYLKWDKTGSFTVTDNAKSDPQKFFVDKKNGIVLLESGKVSMKMDKKAQQIDLVCNKYILTSPDIKLGGASVTEQAVLGTTYRAQETTKNSTTFVSLVNMSVALNSAGAFLAAAAADPVLAGLAPVAAGSIASASSVIITAAAQALAMANAISTFESHAPMYLSNVVKVG